MTFYYTLLFAIVMGFMTLTYLLIVEKPPIFPVSELKANPYTICVLDGDLLVYDVLVQYPKVDKSTPMIIFFYKNIFIKATDKWVPVSTVSNVGGLEYVIRTDASNVHIPVQIDLKTRTENGNFNWRDGEYFLREAVINQGPTNGASTYNVYFVNDCSSD